MVQRLRLHGVDFSGAKDAGRRIWIATGTVTGDTLRIEDCCRAESLPGSRRDRESSLRALRQFILTQHDNVVGLDFPFGLPEPVVRGLYGSAPWEEWVRRIHVDHRTAEGFRDACIHAAQGRELRRKTDNECHAPFSPYNRRIYRQTFHGIWQLITPLVSQNLVSVIPMQRPDPGRPWLLEVCPASTLRLNRLSAPYKFKSREAFEAREHILRSIKRLCGLAFANSRLERAVLQDHRGDALDSIIAVAAVAAGARDFTRVCASPRDVEGYIFT